MARQVRVIRAGQVVAEVEHGDARLDGAHVQLRKALGEETWTAWTKLVDSGRTS